MVSTRSCDTLAFPHVPIYGDMGEGECVAGSCGNHYDDLDEELDDLEYVPIDSYFPYLFALPYAKPFTGFFFFS